jgi:hypothetical protein
VRYLRHLGADALPAWERLARESRDPALRATAAARAAGLREHLERETADWRTWTIRRARLLR